MREIKFIGERVDGQGWITGFLYQSELHSWITDSRNINLETHRNIAWFQVILETVGQYTGVEDKDDKEIYEGDIFKYQLLDITGDEESDTYMEYTEEVVFEDGQFCVEAMPLFAVCKEGEVIGNIHDNKDLLK